MQWCEKTGKQCHDRAGANRHRGAMRRRGRRRAPLDVYRCKHCRAYHVGRNNRA
ncbi:MAG TPA: hypothetical protein VF746_13300 [Longimicrobium sp.]